MTGDALLGFVSGFPLLKLGLCFLVSALKF